MTKAIISTRHGDITLEFLPEVAPNHVKNFIELAKRDMRRAIKDLPDKDLAYLREGSRHFDDYVEAVEWAQRYAAQNRALMMQAVMRAMAGRGGAIVAVASAAGIKPEAGVAAYGASKAGLAGLTQVLAVELARRGIRVNYVIPGFTATEMTAGISARAKAKLVASIPLGREGTAEELADVVWWVAGSPYMTGSIISNDGGLLCRL